MKIHRAYCRRSGGGLIVALVTILVVMLIAGGIVRSLVTDSRETRTHNTELQAHCLADAALAVRRKTKGGNVNLGNRNAYQILTLSPDQFFVGNVFPQILFDFATNDLTKAIVVLFDLEGGHRKCYRFESPLAKMLAT